jgi:chromosome condensin MukBEF ATPase and DNA-binding subunit MukB
MNVNAKIELGIKFEDTQPFIILLRHILTEVKTVNENVEKLQADLNEIQAKLVEQGKVIAKISNESTSTLNKIVVLEGKIAELQDQLAAVDIVLPEGIISSIAEIKGDIQANQSLLSGIDELVPDAPTE